MWRTRITIAYVGALLFLALLAGIGYYLPAAKMQRLEIGAVAVYLTSHQHTLLERGAMLADLLMSADTAAMREQYRNLLRAVADEMEQAHAALLHGDVARSVPAPPPSVLAMYLKPPFEVDLLLRRCVAEIRLLIQRPDSELSRQDSSLQYLLSQASGALAEGLLALASEHQRLNQASVRQLRHWHTVTLVSTLTALAMLGVGVFRPLVRRAQRESDERLRTERLAVIGTMAAKFAHEIRNPLGSIRLNLDSVREELQAIPAAVCGMNNPVPALLRSIDSEVRRIQRISDGYLHFARLPKGERQPLSLNEWLAQQFLICAAELEQRQIRLRTQFASGLPPVEADAGQLWQAVFNIVRNAWEAMPNGGTLTVRTSRARSHVVLEITDTGHGMSEEQQRCVFQPFFSNKDGGTGLGLALAQQIIVEHGGQITCATRPGVGTTFIIHLPAARKTFANHESQHSAH